MYTIQSILKWILLTHIFLNTFSANSIPQLTMFRMGIGDILDLPVLENIGLFKQGFKYIRDNITRKLSFEITLDIITIAENMPEADFVPGQRPGTKSGPSI